MIARDMRFYDYYLYKDKNAYGQRVLNEQPQGQIKMAINSTSQSVQQNALYHNAQFVGFTNDSGVNDTYAIQYGDLLLKVLYVNPKGRYKQVFLAKVK